MSQAVINHKLLVSGMAIELVQKFSETVRVMKSATMLDDFERDRCSKLADVVQRLLPSDSFVRHVCNFMNVLVSNDWFSFRLSSIMAAIHDSAVRMSHP